MKQFISDYFTFNKQERNGIVILLVIIFILLIGNYILNQPKAIEPIDFSDFENAIEKFEAAQNNSKVDVLHHNNPSDNRTKSIELFTFNPNQLSTEDWKRLGLTEKQILVIHHYEAKGGKFYSKADVKKMYCISEKQYLQLEPYIVIPKNKNTIDPPQNSGVQIPLKTKNASRVKIELNSADSSQFLTLKGIGNFYAGKIIKYREQLGGFHSKKQLLELWNFDENKLKDIEEYISVDPSIITKTNINTCSNKQLKHPYLTWTQVKAIINYRNKHGNYQTIQDIKNTDLIDEITFEKISPYITVE